MRRRPGALAVLAAAALLQACASLVPTSDATGSLRFSHLSVDGEPLPATWYLPRGQAAALVLLQPGFTRRCDHLRETSRRLMAAGLMVLCVDAPMAGGNPLLADALARWLLQHAPAADGRALPATLIVAGHSAGARFAARLGAQVHRLAPQRLVGALLFDPVATAGFEADLRLLSDGGQRPVLAVLAPPHGCNAQGNARPALQALRQAALASGRSGFVGVDLVDGGTHADVEGEDSDWIARSACGTPQPVNVVLLRGLAVQWALDLARGATPQPPAAAPGWRAID